MVFACSLCVSVKKYLTEALTEVQVVINERIFQLLRLKIVIWMKKNGKALLWQTIGNGFKTSVG